MQDQAILGLNYTVQLARKSTELVISNNVYNGNINELFVAADNYPIKGDPNYVNGGASNPEAYRLTKGSIAEGQAMVFDQPAFPMAGIGIFKDVEPFPTTDLLGDPIDLSKPGVSCGAYNLIDLGKHSSGKTRRGKNESKDGYPTKGTGDVDANSEESGVTGVTELSSANFDIRIHPNPIKGNVLNISCNQNLQNAIITILDLQGKQVALLENAANAVNGLMTLDIPQNIRNGAYVLVVQVGNQINSELIILTR